MNAYKSVDQHKTKVGHRRKQLEVAVILFLDIFDNCHNAEDREALCGIFASAIRERGLV